MTSDVRPARFGPQGWYPVQPDACRRALAEMAARVPLDDLPARLYGGMAPHAGWAFSGETAVALWAALAARPHPETVLLIGSHAPARPPGRIALHGGWETPLGVIEADAARATTVAEIAGDYLVASDDPWWMDNSVELHLPMMKHFLPAARLVALQVPADDRAANFGRALGERFRGEAVAVAASSDLTHYGPNYDWAPAGSGPGAAAWARESDRRLTERVLALDAEGVAPLALAERSACGPGAIAAATAACVALGATEARLLRYASSLDAAPYHSFVGYASILFGSG